MPATYEPIATTTLGGAAASISFTSITSAYTDLRVVLNVSSTSVNSRAIRMQFNSDTATNYSWTSLYGAGVIAGTLNGTNTTAIQIADQALTSTTIPAFYTSDIFSYTGSKYKIVLSTGSADKNGSGATERIVSMWRSTSAITSVLLLPSSGNFNTGTSATLYGIKAA